MRPGQSWITADLIARLGAVEGTAGRAGGWLAYRSGVHYSAGETIIARDIADGVVLFAWPLRVVDDDDRRLLAAQMPGSVGKVTRGYPSDPAVLLEQLMSGSPALDDLVWSRTLALGVFQPMQWWSTRLMWDAETRDFICYYVDFLRPVARWGRCLDKLDLGLDLVAVGDGTWSWKDEDHLPLVRAAGWLDDAAERHLDLARQEVVAAVEHGAFPFDGSLLELRPSPADPPQLLPDWDAPQELDNVTMSQDSIERDEPPLG